MKPTVVISSLLVAVALRFDHKVCPGRQPGETQPGGFTCPRLLNPTTCC
jgi:hypothetical protein